MAVTPWSVVAGQTPSAAYWNILGTNDAALAAGTAIDDDAILARHIDWASTGSSAGIWWEEIGRTTLGTAGDTITVSSLPARKYLYILFSATATGGTLDTDFYFNGDNTTAYRMSYRVATAAGTDTDTGAVGNLAFDQGTVASGFSEQGRIEMTCISGSRKTGHVHNVRDNSSSAVSWLDGDFIYTSTSALTSVTFHNGGTGDFAIGSEAIVLGHN